MNFEVLSSSIFGWISYRIRLISRWLEGYDSRVGPDSTVAIRWAAKITLPHLRAVISIWLVVAMTFRTGNSASLRNASSELTSWQIWNKRDIVTFGNIGPRVRPINYVQLIQIWCEMVTIISKTLLVGALLSGALSSVQSTRNNDKVQMSIFDTSKFGATYSIDVFPISENGTWMNLLPMRFFLF